MIISHSKQFAFFRVPKTGSTTISMILRLVGGFDDTQDVMTNAGMGLAERNVPTTVVQEATANIGRYEASIGDTLPTDFNLLATPTMMHMSPSQAVTRGLLTEQQLKSYQCFAVVRDPVERYVSAYRYTMRLGASPQGLVDWLNQKRNLGYLERPQSDYADPNVTLLDFADMKGAIQQLLTALGVSLTLGDIPKINDSLRAMSDTDTSSYITPAVRAHVAAHFADDALIWQHCQTAFKAKTPIKAIKVNLAELRK